MVTYKIKLLFHITFNILFTGFIIAQDHGVNWILGYGVKNDTSLYGRTILDFLGNSLKLIRNSGGFKFTLGFENNSYSDDQGNLKFFYDGFRLGNASDFNIIKNGDTLNPGIIWKTYLGGFYPISDASVFLKGENDLVYLFHKSIDVFQSPPIWHSPFLYCTVIDSKLENGKGRVIEKNKLILSVSQAPNVFSSCLHGNGRDWWIISKNIWNSIYYKILFTKNGNIKIDSQNIGSTSAINFNTSGNSSFSPNGKLFIRISLGDKIQIFDFDRCNGVLSNYRQVLNDSLGSTSFANIAISSNSRFLYASTNTRIFQYDLEANDIQGSMEVIGEWDGFIYDKSFTTSFCDMQLASDDKIYVSCSSGNIYLHVINEPNLKGNSCDFQLREVTLPTYIACGLGNYPNYLLGPEKISICDTLTLTNNFRSEENFTFYPNPSDGRLHIVDKLSGYSRTFEIEIVDISGNITCRQGLQRNQKYFDFDFSFLDPGLYFVRFSIDQRLVQSRTWVVY